MVLGVMSTLFCLEKEVVPIFSVKVEAGTEVVFEDPRPLTDSGTYFVGTNPQCFVSANRSTGWLGLEVEAHASESNIPLSDFSRYNFN